MYRENATVSLHKLSIKWILVCSHLSENKLEAKKKKIQLSVHNMFSKFKNTWEKNDSHIKYSGRNMYPQPLKMENSTLKSRTLATWIILLFKCDFYFMDKITKYGRLSALLRHCRSVRKKYWTSYMFYDHIRYAHLYLMYNYSLDDTDYINVFYTFLN